MTGQILSLSATRDDRNSSRRREFLLCKRDSFAISISGVPYSTATVQYGDPTMKRHHWLIAVTAAVFGAAAFFWTQGPLRAPERATESPTPIADSATPKSEAALTLAGSQALPGPVAPPSRSPAHGVEPTAQNNASAATRDRATDENRAHPQRTSASPRGAKCCDRSALRRNGH